jgi:hypothetical protein
MAQFDVFDVVGDGIQALGLLHHLLGRDEDELRVLIHELPDRPLTGHAIDLDALARDPFHRCLLMFASKAARAFAVG